MVQKEVRKKTQVYGTIAILSAIMLVALIYAYGITPGAFTPNSPSNTQQPNSPNTPNSPNNNPNSPSDNTLNSQPITSLISSPMKTFTSLTELTSFLAAKTTTDASSSFGGGPLDAQFLGGTNLALSPNSAAPSASAFGTYGVETSTAQPSYSTTNIQVAGVDEADTVKTDGRYIYSISRDTTSSQDTVFIVNANPQDAKITGKIPLGNNSYPAGLFLSSNGNKLVILGSHYDYQAVPMVLTAIPNQAVSMAYPYFVNNVKSFIYVYDVSDKSSPVLTRNLTLSGSYFNSRMIGDYVYAVISQPAYLYNNAVTLPKVYGSTVTTEISPTKVYYTDTIAESYFTFTTFAGLNVTDDAQEPSSMTVMMGGTSNMYVSQTNIYVTYPSSDGKGSEIYRVSVNGEKLVFEAQGKVPGYILNQYSMDEFNGNFRLATTTSRMPWLNQGQQNNLYVLNKNLTIIGKLEGFAQNESIYSARFIGDKCYIVTFRQIDPFFIIDLSNPAAPAIAGELKIPGYSSYLHPYDENHVIGLGKENGSVKISLFDVTNINNPVEIAKYIVEGTYSDSEALYDPKAFLFDLQKQLLVIPVSITNYGVISTGPEAVGAPTPTSAGYWQGAYVFKLTTEGFTLKGTVSHQDSTTSTPYYYWYNYDQMVNRALYIDNTLYTISNSKIQLNNLDTLNLVAKVNLS